MTASTSSPFRSASRCAPPRRVGSTPPVSGFLCPASLSLCPASLSLSLSLSHARTSTLALCAHCAQRADETYYFAYCFPYTYSYLQRFLFALESKQLPFLQRDCLCRSLQERRLDLLTISSPANLKLDAHLQSGAPHEPPSPRAASECRPPVPVVFLSSRVHPGESPASFVMHGLLLFLASEHPKAKELREAVILKVVPMLNPDGVFLGNYRCNSVGLDLNRLWHASVPGTAPTIHAMRLAAQKYCASGSGGNGGGSGGGGNGGGSRLALDMIIDMHAHSTCMNGFIFANMPSDPRDMDKVSAFPKALGSLQKDFAQASCKFDTDPSKAGTGRRALSELLPGVHCYTLEVSMFCASAAAATGGGNTRGEPYLPASYTEMGNAIGLALHDHYCAGGRAAAAAASAAAHAGTTHARPTAASAAAALPSGGLAAGSGASAASASSGGFCGGGTRSAAAAGLHGAGTRLGARVGMMGGGGSSSSSGAGLGGSGGGGGGGVLLSPRGEKPQAPNGHPSQQQQQQHSHHHTQPHRALSAPGQRETGAFAAASQLFPTGGRQAGAGGVAATKRHGGTVGAGGVPSQWTRRTLAGGRGGGLGSSAGAGASVDGGGTTPHPALLPAPGSDALGAARRRV